MANLIMYRSYPFKSEEQDPIIGQVEEALAKEELNKKAKLVSELSGISTTTFYNWFVKKKTRNPRFATVAAIYGALGYYPNFKRTERFDLEGEMRDAKRWNLRRQISKIKPKKRNGNGKEARA